MVRPSRALLRAVLAWDEDVVLFEQEGWLDLTREALETRYLAQVSCAQEDLGACKEGVLDILVTPIDAGYQLLYPSVERISRDGLRWQIALVVKVFLTIDDVEVAPERRATNRHSTKAAAVTN